MAKFSEMCVESFTKELDNFLPMVCVQKVVVDDLTYSSPFIRAFKPPFSQSFNRIIFARCWLLPTTYIQYSNLFLAADLAYFRSFQTQI